MILSNRIQLNSLQQKHPFLIRSLIMKYHQIAFLFNQQFVLLLRHIWHFLVKNILIDSIPIPANSISLHWLLSMTTMVTVTPFQVIVVFVRVSIVSMNFPIWIQQKCHRCSKVPSKKSLQVIIYIQNDWIVPSNLRDYRLEIFVSCNRSPFLFI